LYGGVPPYQPYYGSIESVRATGPLEVEFRLKEPNAVFLKNLAMFSASIASPTAIKKHGEAYRDHPAGTGPFRFKSWTKGQEIVLEAFDDHWRGRPKLDRAIFLKVAESSILGEQLKRGEIHIADNMKPSDLDALAKEPGIHLQEQPGMNVGYLCFQTEKPPLNNPKVRRAIGMAIDKERLVDVAFSGHARPAVNPLPPTIWGYNEAIEDRPFDVAAARQLLKEASEEDGFELPLKLKLYQMATPRPYMQQPRQAAALIKDSLAEIGVETTIVAIDTSQYFGRLSAGEHDIGLAGWTTDKVDPDDFLFTFFHSDNISNDGGNNMSRYRNPEVDALLEQAQRELDDDKRAGLYRRVQEIVFADAPLIPLVHTDVRIAQRDELKGYKLHPSSLVRLRLAHLGDSDGAGARNGPTANRDPAK
jgi:peptide/nickel transport system substrate-binding protein